MLRERDTFSNIGSFDALEKKFSITVPKTKTKSCLNLHCNGNNRYFFVNGKNAISLKFINFNFPNQFCLGSISNKFDYVECEEVSLKRNADRSSRRL